MNTVKTIAKTTGNILFYALITCIFAAVIASALGIKPYITMSGSMEPAIHTGSVCFVNTNVSYDEIHTGDIIAYRSETGGLVTHRVIDISDAGMETKGDANDVSDGISTTRDNFYGKNILTIPYIGYAIKHLQTPAGMSIAGVILVTCIVLAVLGNTNKKKEASR